MQCVQCQMQPSTPWPERPSIYSSCPGVARWRETATMRMTSRTPTYTSATRLLGTCRMPRQFSLADACPICPVLSHPGWLPPAGVPLPRCAAYIIPSARRKTLFFGKDFQRVPRPTNLLGARQSWQPLQAFSRLRCLLQG